MKKLLPMLICVGIFGGCDAADLLHDSTKRSGAASETSDASMEAEHTAMEAQAQPRAEISPSRHGSDDCTCTTRRSGVLRLDRSQSYAFTLPERESGAETYVLALTRLEGRRAVLGLFKLAQPTRSCDVAHADVRLIRYITLPPGKRVVVEEIEKVLLWPDRAPAASSDHSLGHDLTLVYGPLPALPSTDPRTPTRPEPHGSVFMCPVDPGSFI